MNVNSVVLGVALVLLAKFAHADSYQPSHTCTKPYQPHKFTSKRAIDNFKIDAERYKQCIEEFVEEQQRAIDIHRNAAGQAINEWNSYVRCERS